MKPLDEFQRLVLRPGRQAVEGPPGSGKSTTLEGYVAWQKSRGKSVGVFVRKRVEAKNLRDRGVNAFTLQRNRYDALGRPEIAKEDLDLLLETLQAGEKQADVLVVDEIHNWSPDFFDVAKSLWSGEDFLGFYDVHQSLMYWAGAVRDLEGEMEDIFGVTKTVHLVNNYRSAPKIVEALKAIVPREMVSAQDKYGRGHFHIERCYNFENECRFLYNELLNGYDDVQILARNSSICRRISNFFKKMGVKHELYLAGGEEPLGSSIIVQTIHTAQATEHVTVFVVSCVQGILPDYRSQESDEHNVFYVGCSRAMRDLFISYYGAPSMFITEALKRKSEQKRRS